MPAVPEAPPDSGKVANPAAVPFTHGLTGVNLSLDDTATIALWLSVAIICLVVLLGRLGQLANGHIRQLLSMRENSTSVKYWETDKTSIWPWLKRHVIYSPLHKKRHNKEIMLSRAISVGTLPSRLHTAILVVYLVSNLVYCLVLSYHDKPQAAVLAELRGRTGHLAMVNMVPLVILAGRNNPLIYLLHVSFDTYNLFHRWIGRLVVLQAVVHTIAWAANEHTAKGSGAVSDALAKNPFLGYGLVGTIAMVSRFQAYPHLYLARSVVSKANFELNLGPHPYSISLSRQTRLLRDLPALSPSTCSGGNHWRLGPLRSWKTPGKIIHSSGPDPVAVRPPRSDCAHNIPQRRQEWSLEGDC